MFSGLMTGFVSKKRVEQVTSQDLKPYSYIVPKADYSSSSGTVYLPMLGNWFLTVSAALNGGESVNINGGGIVYNSNVNGQINICGYLNISSDRFTYQKIGSPSSIVMTALLVSTKQDTT